jgi:hypothetical protein
VVRCIVGAAPFLIANGEALINRGASIDEREEA